MILLVLLKNAHSLIYNQIDCFAFFFRHTLTLVSLCRVFKARQYILILIALTSSQRQDEAAHGHRPDEISVLQV